MEERLTYIIVFRVVYIYIRNDILTVYPLHSNQHAYQRDKSTEKALHHMVHYIEKAMEDKEVVMGAFIDIEGAFNCTSKRAIVAAASRHNIPQTIIRWIEGMLSGRRVFSEWNDKRVKGLVDDGCPQGGVSSPLLWNLVVDELIRILNDLGFFAVGYADDIVILIKGKCEEILPDILERGLNTAKRWCEEKSLRVNPTKTEIVIFTRKYKLKSCRQIRFCGQRIPYAERVKYLRVYLNMKLKWNIHFEARHESTSHFYAV